MLFCRYWESGFGAIRWWVQGFFTISVYWRDWLSWMFCGM